MITPFIKLLDQNGTFFSLQSPNEDIGIFLGSTRKIRFSKFALLDIPDIGTPSDNENLIQFNAVEGAYTQGLSTASPSPAGDRFDLSQSFQNYLLNLETLVRKQNSYDPDLDATVSERIFWKWMKEIGAVRFQTATSSQKSPLLTEDRWVEEDDNYDSGQGDIYKRVVKHIGDISIVASRKTSAGGYTEVYVYVPIDSADTPDPLFKTVSDTNYFPGMAIRSDDIANQEYIEGRTSADDPTPLGLDAHAFYDMDTAASFYDYTMDAVGDDYWFENFAPNGPNAYFTEAAFNDASNNLILREDPNSLLPDVTYKRSRLDGIQLDLEANNHPGVASNSAVDGFTQLNRLSSTESFDFNAVLIYYDVYDASDPDTVLATNLYGVLFLGDLEVSAGNSRITPFTKITSNTVNQTVGNSFAVKLGIKFDASADNVFVETETDIDPNSPFVMDLFMQSTQELNSLMETHLSLLNDYAGIKQEMEDLKKLVSSGSTLLTQDGRIKALEEIIKSGEDVNITDMQAKLLNIEAAIGSLSSPDYEFVRGFNGIDASESGSGLILRNTKKLYDTIYNQELDVNITGVNTITVGENTLLAHSSSSALVVSNTIVINLDDTDNTWVAGNRFTLMVTSPLTKTGNKAIVINTGSNFDTVVAAYETAYETFTIDVIYDGNSFISNITKNG